MSLTPHSQALNPLEEAHTLQGMIGTGRSQRDVARSIGRSEPYVSQRLGLLSLHPGVQEALANGEIAATVAEQLFRLSLQHQIAALPHIRGKSSRQAQQIILQHSPVSRNSHVKEPAPQDEDTDLYGLLLADGNDPLLVAALHQLAEAHHALEEVYATYPLHKSTGVLREHLRSTARTCQRCSCLILEALGTVEA